MINKLKKTIPTAVTLLGMVITFVAIKMLLGGYLLLSFGLILIAFIFDIFDGVLARHLDAEFRIGAILDSIADVFLYLMYPGIIFVLASHVSVYILISSTIFVFAGIFRLVRFTKTGFVSDSDKKYYSGLPVFFSIPIAGVLVLFILNNYLIPISYACIILTVLSILMVSKIRVRKITNVKTLVSFSAFVFVMAIIFILA